MDSHKTAFQSFMTGIIDYAGLYPPADLPLNEAFQNFRAYQSAPEAWMLSRFVIPAKRLAELPVFDETLSFTILGRSGKDVDDFLENLKLDIDDINLFRNLHPKSNADMFEVALPASSLTDKFTANDIITRAADALNKNGIMVFFEAPFNAAQGKPFDETWQDRAHKLLRALRKVKDKHVGFKLRTGGVTENAFPSPAQIAWAITEVRESGVPMKCTAGLHHPIRHFNESVQTKMHGFLNVFGAGVLAFANGISETEMQDILEDENPANFVFDETAFKWNELRVAANRIAKARLFITSFGSCSFDEPRDDLRVLELL